MEETIRMFTDLSNCVLQLNVIIQFFVINNRLDDIRKILREK